MCTYVYIYVRTYIHTYVLHTYVRTCLLSKCYECAGFHAHLFRHFQHDATTPYMSGRYPNNGAITYIACPSPEEPTTSAHPCLRRSLTMSECPQNAAMQRGANPSEDTSFGSAPCFNSDSIPCMMVHGKEIANQ